MNEKIIVYLWLSQSVNGCTQFIHRKQNKITLRLMWKSISSYETLHTIIKGSLCTVLFNDSVHTKFYTVAYDVRLLCSILLLLICYKSCTIHNGTEFSLNLYVLMYTMCVSECAIECVFCVFSWFFSVQQFVINCKQQK